MFQQCQFCVMDSSASEFVTSIKLGCFFCSSAKREISGYTRDLDLKINLIKREKGKGKYHALLGLSGGLDSSFLLHEVSKLNLDILIVHIDSGWNTSEAVKNIYNLVSKVNMEFRTVVLDWSSIKTIQNILLRSGVMNQDALQDHIFTASLVSIARKEGISTILSGLNLAGESIGPKSWGHRAIDARWMKSILKSEQCNWPESLPKWSVLRNTLNHYIKREFRVISILDDLSYSPSQAKEILRDQYGYIDYGGKHNESVFTKFFQKIYLPERFGVDKRKSHLSSLIVSGEITRDEAICQLNESPINPEERNSLIALVADKLGLEGSQLEELIKIPSTNLNLKLKNEEYIDKILDKLSRVKNRK